MTGALLIDKPSGPTSHDVVAFARRLLKTTRIGHTGTLDPLATGLLVLLVGPATRLAQFLVADEKEYIAEVRLGVATPTYDAASLADGGSDVRDPITDTRDPITDIREPRTAIQASELEAVLDRFRGSFLQTPPPYSAKKVAGIAAYEKARRNEPVDLKPVPVTVRELHVLPASDTGDRRSGIEPQSLLRLRVAASSGFYVRSLAHEIGQALGCGAHLEGLRRTRAGRFRVEDAATLDVLDAAGTAAAGRLIPMEALLCDLTAVSLTEEGAKRAAHGNSLAPSHLQTPVEVRSGDRVRVLTAERTLLAVAEARPDGLLHPLVVLR